MQKHLLLNIQIAILIQCLTRSLFEFSIINKFIINQLNYCFIRIIWSNWVSIYWYLLNIVCKLVYNCLLLIHHNFRQFSVPIKSFITYSHQFYLFFNIFLPFKRILRFNFNAMKSLSPILSNICTDYKMLNAHVEWVEKWKKPC